MLARGIVLRPAMNLTSLSTLLLLLQLGPNAKAYDPTEDDAYPVRLVGGDASTEGRVEIYFNGAWGSVCGNFFDSAAAAVICRQLGFSGRSLAIQKAYFGEGAGHVLIENVACRGNESRLTDCDFPGWGSSCAHNRDASVICQMDIFDVRLGGNSMSKAGRVEMKFEGQWMAICADHWTASVTSVVCRQLGLHGDNISYVIENDGDSFRFLSGIDCKGNEVALADCGNDGLRSATRFNCGGVYVSCQIHEEEFLSVRLAGGLSSNQGYLELYHSGQWGTVLRDGWDASATSVVCRQLGFPGHNITLDFFPGDDIFGQVESLLLLIAIQCKGDEDKIADCDLTSGAGKVNCNYCEAVGIICQEGILADDHRLRLVQGGTNGNRSGLVEMSVGGHWLAVSPAEGFEASMASVACRQLGLFGRNVSVVDSSSYNIGRHDVKCTGDEALLKDCPYDALTTLFTENAVVCQVGETIPVRLVDGADNTTGHVQVFFNAMWVSVCGSLWDVRSSIVVCRQLGFRGQAMPLSVGFVSGTHYLSSVLCQGDELRLDECDLSWDTFCIDEFAGVACQLDGETAIRLAGGATDAEGRVEIFLNGHWLTVHDELWNIHGATVVCRQLGFNGSSLSVSYSMFGPGSGRMYMDKVNCQGDEETLFDCRFSAMPRRLTYLPFIREYQAGVVCQADGNLPIRLTGGATTREGRVEILFRGQWGAICHQKTWGASNADVVCRQLGFHNGTNLVVAGSYYTDEDLPAYLNGLHCKGNESKVIDCLEMYGNSFSVGSCGQDSFIGVKCLSDEEFPVRLRDGFSAGSGNVEIFFDGKWGGLCISKLYTGYATVVCNQLGYDGAEAPVYTSLFGSKMTYHIKDMKCVGNESRLADCPFHGWKINVGYCRHSAGVVCKVHHGAFGATCPPSEAVPDPFDAQRPTILRYSTNGSSVLPVMWDSPMLTNASGEVVNFTTCRMADGEGAPWPCRSGDLFNATGFSNDIGRKVKVEFAATDLHTNRSHNCTFYILVKEVSAFVPVLNTSSNGSRSDGFYIAVAIVQCPEEVTDTAIGSVMWPATPSGSVAVSSQLCSLHTEKAGIARFTRNCTSRMVSDLTSVIVWEEPVAIDCGGSNRRTTIQDLTSVQVASGNAVEVAELLANLTSWGKGDDASTRLSLVDIANILLDIAVAGSGEIEVAEYAVDIVNNIAGILRGENPAAPARLSVALAVTKSLEMQVCSTFHARGPFSIQTEFVFVETISVNSSQAQNGFSLTVVQRREEASTHTKSVTARSTPISTEVFFSGEENPSPLNESVRAVIVVPNNTESLRLKKGSESTSYINVTLILYEDDSLFPSAITKDASFTILEGVVSVEVKGVTQMNWTEPVVAEFRAPPSADTDKVMCVFWDFTLGNGTGDWSSAGCHLDGMNSGRYVCRCDRLTNLAVLMSSPKLADYPATLDLIGRISCIGSAGSYLLILTLYLSLRKLRGSRSGHIFLQFLVSLLMLYSVFVAGVDYSKRYQHVCTAVAISLHYLPLTTIMWTAVQSRAIYVRSLGASSTTDGFWKGFLQSIFAWGSPLILAAVTFIFGSTQYEHNHHCIMTPSLPMFIGMLLPITLVLAHNLVTAAMTVYRLRRAKRDGDATSSEPMALRLAVAVSIWILLTISLSAGFLSVHSTSRVFPVMFAVANCIMVLMVCCMTSLHWCEDEGNSQLEPASACPANEQRDVSATSADTHEHGTTEKLGCSSIVEKEEDGEVAMGVEKREGYALQSADRLTKPNPNPDGVEEIDKSIVAFP